MYKAESTLATHIRTGKISLKVYLYQQRVPAFESPECDCNNGTQTAKHVLMHCRSYQALRVRMFAAAATNVYEKIVQTAKGLKTATRMLIETGLLGQFELAGSLLYGEVQ